MLIFFFFFPIFFFLIFLCIFLLILSKLMLKSEFMKKNMSSMHIYECGYMMFDNYEKYYSLQFFLIALSFMFFDLEIVLFMPFIFSLNYNFYIFFSSIFFIFLLTLSLLMEFTLSVF